MPNAEARWSPTATASSIPTRKIWPVQIPPIAPGGKEGIIATLVMNHEEAKEIKYGEQEE